MRPAGLARRFGRMLQANTGDQIDVAKFKLRALELRRQGKGFQAIADTLKAEGGPGSLSRAHELVVGGLADLRRECREAAADVRDLEISRCDGMIEVLWARLTEETGGKSGVGSKTAARLVDSILRVQDRKAKYLGLDAPKRIEATGGNGAPLLPPGSVVVQFVRPGEPIPPPPEKPAETGPTAEDDRAREG